MTYDALLFDLDGTLINSIDLWGQAIGKAFETLGITITQDHFREWYKRGLHLSNWLAEFGLTEEDAPHFRQVRDDRYVELLRTKIAWMAGAEETLLRFRDALPLGLITGSHRHYVEASDANLHYLPSFRVVITEDEMGGFHKPHPHGLLLATDQLGLQPANCLYVCDQLFDVDACKAAGMPCCLVPNEFTPQEAKDAANFVLPSLHELPKLLR